MLRSTIFILKFVRKSIIKLQFSNQFEGLHTDELVLSDRLDFWNHFIWSSHWTYVEEAWQLKQLHSVNLHQVGF